MPKEAEPAGSVLTSLLSQSLAEPVLPLALQFGSWHCHQTEGFLSSIVPGKRCGEEKVPFLG